MIFHIKNNNTQEEFKNVKGNNYENGLPIGFDSDLSLFVQVEEEVPQYDHRTHKLERVTNWSDKVSDTYSHCKEYQITYTLTQLPDEDIISNIDRELGSHLDGNYIIPIRVKHLKEGTELTIKSLNEVLTTEEQSRLDYLVTLGTWLNTCRAERDLMETELISNGVIPNFEFTPKP